MQILSKIICDPLLLPLCILCEAWIYFTVSSSGTVVLRSDRLVRLKSLRFSMYQKNS